MSNEEIVSRRALLTGSALLGVAATVQACSSDSATDAGTADGGATDGGVDMTAADITVLNALLTAEYQAVKAYDAGAAILMAPPATDPQVSVAPVVLAVAAHFQQQHRDHATQVAAAVTAAGGTPVTAASVTFTAPANFTGSVANVIKLACNAEKGAAIAYNGAVAALSTPTRRFLAGTIEGDETQHFIVLYLLLKSAVNPTAMVATSTNDVVPDSFVSSLGGTNGLQATADLAYTA